jgi:hypothetical protein
MAGSFDNNPLRNPPAVRSPAIHPDLNPITAMTRTFLPRADRQPDPLPRTARAADRASA